METNSDNIDTAVSTLYRLKGMFGVMAYLTNPDGIRTGYPSEDFESWFADIQDKLDSVVNLLCET